MLATLPAELLLQPLIQSSFCFLSSDSPWSSHLYFPRVWDCSCMLPWPALTFLQSYSCNHDHSLILDTSDETPPMIVTPCPALPNTLSLDPSQVTYIFFDSVACFRSVYERITQHIAFSDCFSYLTFVSPRLRHLPTLDSFCLFVWCDCVCVLACIYICVYVCRYVCICL